jgi:hypothetical protein
MLTLRQRRTQRLGNQKKQMNKDERKQYNKKITYECLKTANRNEQLAEKMAKKKVPRIRHRK